MARNAAPGDRFTGPIRIAEQDPEQWKRDVAETLASAVAQPCDYDQPELDA